MKIFISADMEGICGVIGPEHWRSEGADYGEAREWMVQEVNAAIEGARSAGTTTFVVKDAHNQATNILPHRLDAAAELISGWGPIGSMVEGIDSSFDAVMLIGYHARAGTADGTLSHTWTSRVRDLTVNGRSIGETTWAAMFAGSFGVPLAMVTGDQQLINQLPEELPEGYLTVVTKTGLARRAARMRPMETVRQEIRETAAIAVSRRDALPVVRSEPPLTITLRLTNWQDVTPCEAVPGVERIEVDLFRYVADDMVTAQRYFNTLLRLSNSSI